MEQVQPEQTPNDETDKGTWKHVREIIGEIKWAWDGWLPGSMITMLVGDQESGKSILALRIASVFVRGEKWPDGSKYTGETGKVLWIETEASQGLNVLRAVKWGIPLEQIMTPDAEDPMMDIALEDPAHRELLAAKIRDETVKCAIVDSFSGGNNRDENSVISKDSIKWLAELSRDEKKPIIIVHHLRKPTVFDIGNDITLSRVRGSTGITQFARVVWAVDKPDSTIHTRRLQMIKFNFGEKPTPMGMMIHDRGVTFTSNAPEKPRAKKKSDMARDFLRELLSDGPVEATKVEKDAKDEKISMETVNKAKKDLGIGSRRNGKDWEWYLPGT